MPTGVVVAIAEGAATSVAAAKAAVMIVVSAVLPLAWFKLRGWL